MFYDFYSLNTKATNGKEVFSYLCGETTRLLTTDIFAQLKKKDKTFIRCGPLSFVLVERVQVFGD